MVEELKKLKVSLSAFELLRVPSIQNGVLGAYSTNVILQDKTTSDIVSKVSSSQVLKY